MGRKFEEYIKQVLPYLGLEKFSRIGSWWYKENEIDVVALNDDSKEILFCGCKWKDNVNAEKILEDLREKSKLVNWNNGLQVTTKIQSRNGL